MDPPFVRDRIRARGVDGEAPACQPPTSAPSPHRATVVWWASAKMCGLSRGRVHGGVVQVRAGSRVVVRWERTAQKSESPPMPDANIRRQKAS